MKLFSSMIASDGWGWRKRYYMKKAWCNICKDGYIIPIHQSLPRCRKCGAKMRAKWVNIDEPDYTEFYEKFDEPKKETMKEVGKKPQKYHD